MSVNTERPQKCIMCNQSAYSNTETKLCPRCADIVALELAEVLIVDENVRYIPVPMAWVETFDTLMAGELVQVARVTVGQKPSGAEWHGPMKGANTNDLLWFRPFRYTLEDEDTQPMWNADAATAYDRTNGHAIDIQVIAPHMPARAKIVRDYSDAGNGNGRNHR